MRAGLDEFNRMNGVQFTTIYKRLLPLMCKTVTGKRLEPEPNASLIQRFVRNSVHLAQPCSRCLLAPPLQTSLRRTSQCIRMTRHRESSMCNTLKTMSQRFSKCEFQHLLAFQHATHIVAHVRTSWLQPAASSRRWGQLRPVPSHPGLRKNHCYTLIATM